MRVTGPASQFGVPTAKVKNSGENDDERFELPEFAQSAQAKKSGSAAASNAMGSLIAAQMQNVEEKEARRKRREKGVRHGRALLDLMEDLKIGMLSGKLSAPQILNLIGNVDAREHDSGDPRLEALLDEIELRAKVELAKLQRREEA